MVALDSDLDGTGKPLYSKVYLPNTDILQRHTAVTPNPQHLNQAPPCQSQQPISHPNTSTNTPHRILHPPSST
ncbi:hypothetical protein IAQ61_005004 [Plenodomus lingam]|uniref:uncharacterized protein n=1 Tax=Leptosphaeria maculans TaxID=5022 RepID=UPI003332F068|nr:hypothetical protein IAQ61_005004 [Plenodomus lingam]